MKNARITGLDRESEIVSYCIKRTPMAPDLFWSCFLDEDDTFLKIEGEYWDFKSDWPFERSNEYFYSICRHICAFANNSGGVLIFNVDDDSRQAKNSKVKFNADSFLQGIGQIMISPTAISDSIFFHEYTHTSGTKHPAIFIRPKLVGEPVWRFQVPKDPKYSGEKIFFRKGHESREAKPDDYTQIFLGAADDGTDGSPQLNVKIPPTPTTVKRFIGRSETLARLFDWVNDPDTPVAYLWGKGGSGKSTIAWHLCRLFRDRGTSPQFSHCLSFENICFLSAKSRMFDTKQQIPQEIIDTDFTDRESLFKRILEVNNYSSDEEYTHQISSEKAQIDIKELFGMTSILLVIDDIDTLTTAGEDIGLARLTTFATRSERVKILITQRNQPQNALDAAIEVPGLSKTELTTFCSTCAEQFGVPAPKQSEMSQISTLTENRPLAVETLIALRRATPSYEKATEKFRREAGENLRQYIFRREWDAIPPESRGRELLTALALLNRSATFEEIEVIMQTSQDQVSDAISVVKEMFLKSTPSESEAYELAELTRRFVLSICVNLDLFSTVKERVNNLKRESRYIPPIVQKFQQDIERKLPSKHWWKHSKENSDIVEKTIHRIEEEGKNAVLSEDVGFRQYRAYVYSLDKRNNASQIFEDVKYVNDMKKQVAEKLLPAISKALCKETATSYGEQLHEIVAYNTAYSGVCKQTIRKELARRLREIGHEFQFSDVEKALSLGRKSLELNLLSLHYALDHNDSDKIHLEKHCQKTAAWLLKSVSHEPLEFSKILGSLKLRDDPVIYPLQFPIIECARAFETSGMTKRDIGRADQGFRRLLDFIGNGKWEDSESRLDNIRDEITLAQSKIKTGY